MREATRLCLIRHGETDWNRSRRIQGCVDVALNGQGLRQAQLVAAGLRGQPLAALYSSDLQRAWQTAAAIGAATGLAPQALAGLRERAYGVFEGLAVEEARWRHPELYAAYSRRDPDCDFCGGESLRAVFARASRQIETLAARHVDASIAVVLHGGLLDAINRFVRGIVLEAPRDFAIPNAAFNWIRRDATGWHVEIWGDTRHLEETADELAA